MWGESRRRCGASSGTNLATVAVQAVDDFAKVIRTRTFLVIILQVRSHICAGTADWGPPLPTSAPGLRSPPPTSVPGLGLTPSHICAGTALTPSHICAGAGPTALASAPGLAHIRAEGGAASDQAGRDTRRRRSLRRVASDRSRGRRSATSSSCWRYTHSAHPRRELAAHVRAGTRPRPRRDSPTSAPGLAHVRAGTRPRLRVRQVSCFTHPQAALIYTAFQVEP
jgi:hypothetical protein